MSLGSQSESRKHNTVTANYTSCTRGSHTDADDARRGAPLICRLPELTLSRRVPLSEDKGLLAREPGTAVWKRTSCDREGTRLLSRVPQREHMPRNVTITNLNRRLIVTQIIAIND